MLLFVCFLVQALLFALVSLLILSRFLFFFENKYLQVL